MRPASLAVSLAAVLFAAGCSDLLATTSTTTSVTPVTGLRVRASTMFDGLGCGDGPTVPHVWGGVVYAKGSTTPIAARVVDCFADLVFHDLPVTDAAVDTYTIALVAFTSPAWSTVPADVQTKLRGGQVAEVGALAASWRASCEGVQEQGLRRDAVCSRFTVETTDAGAPVTTTDAGTDAAPESDAATADASDADAGT